MIFTVRVNVGGDTGGAPGEAFTASGSSTRAGRVSYSGGRSAVGAGALAAAAAAAGGPVGGAEMPDFDDAEQEVPAVQQRVVDEQQQVRRNDPCRCGRRQQL